VGGDHLQPGVTTVTPTRRLAHWLRIRYGDACLRQGQDVWRTPDIVAWPDLVQRMFEQERRDGRLPGRWLPDGAARLAWARMTSRDPATAGLVSPDRLGWSAHRSWQRMHAWEIPVAALGTEDRPESVAFARWAAEYADWLNGGDWVDQAIATTRLGSTAPADRIELAGFDELTPAQHSLLGRVESAGGAVTHRMPDQRHGSVAWVQCRDRIAELDVAARWAASRLDRDPQARLAIVVPDLVTRRDEVRRSVERVIVPEASLARGPAPESRGFELAAARALSAQPVVGAALDLIDAFSGTSDLEAVSRLLRNPFLAPSGEADSRARLDAYLRRYEGPDLGLARLAQLAGQQHCPGLERVLRAGLEQASQWPMRALPSGWSQYWFRLLAIAGWPGDGLDRDEYQASQRGEQLIAEMGSNDDCTGMLGAAEARSTLRDLADSVLFEPQELRAGLLVVDPDTSAGMSFDALWVCGLDTARWPAPASPDPFLPREWQKSRRVPGATAEISAAGAKSLLERLCRSADEVVLSVPRFDGDAPLLPSALLAGIPYGDVPECWSAPAPAATIFAARPALEHLVDGAMPEVVPEEASRGGARLLEIQSACPFRAQAEFRLGARRLDDPELGVAAADRGELVHAVLARIWGKLRAQSALRRLSPDELRTTIRLAITEEVAPLLHSAQGFMRRLLDIEAEWLLARVTELLACDAGRPPFSVESVEEDCTIAIGGLTLRLRVDRIDRLADGSVAIIDYKTGADAETNAWLGERPRLPQLPLYAEAVDASPVSAIAFGRVRAGDSGYIGLTRDAATFTGLTTHGSRGWPPEHASWEELRAAWRRRLTALAREHATGDARLAPDPVHACRYCQLGPLCRIGETRLGAVMRESGDE
jgi:ATP-dependent helicase/nuclease subunit B